MTSFPRTTSTSNIISSTYKKVLLVTFEVYFYQFQRVYELMEFFNPDLFLTDDVYFCNGLKMIKYLELKGHFVRGGEISQEELLFLKKTCEVMEINSESELFKILEELKPKA